MEGRGRERRGEREICSSSWCWMSTSRQHPQQQVCVCACALGMAHAGLRIVGLGYARRLHVAVVQAHRKGSTLSSHRWCQRPHKAQGTKKTLSFAPSAPLCPLLTTKELVYIHTNLLAYVRANSELLHPIVHLTLVLASVQGSMSPSHQTSPSM